jgi:hypothetical protein
MHRIGEGGNGLGVVGDVDERSKRWRSTEVVEIE